MNQFVHICACDLNQIAEGQRSRLGRRRRQPKPTGWAVCGTRHSRLPAATGFRVGALLGQSMGSEEAVVAVTAKATTQQRRKRNKGADRSS